MKKTIWNDELFEKEVATEKQKQTQLALTFTILVSALVIAAVIAVATFFSFFTV